MNTDALITELVGLIQPLFRREPNTIYEVQIIHQRYSGRLNIFFEWHRIGRATVSREIKSLPFDGEQLPLIVQRLRHATELPVHLDQ